MKRRRRRRPRLCGWRNPAERARGRICCHPACPCTGTRSATGSRRGPRCARGSERTSRRWARRIRSCLPAPRARARPPSSRCWRTGCDAEGARILASTTVSTTTRLRTRARPPPPPPRVLFRGARRERAKTRRRPRSQKTPRRREKGSPLSCSRTRSRTPRSQDTAHFLEKAGARHQRAFGIAERLPRDAADLPECFARFLERAALHRRVVVIVDACESARCAPCAGVGAAAVAGLDPRENAPASFSTEKRETTSKKSPETLDAALDAHLDAHIAASNAHLVDLRAHFKWLPQSPPLAVRFVLACREEGADFLQKASSVSATRRAPRASPWRAPSSPARPRRELCTRCPP